MTDDEILASIARMVEQEKALRDHLVEAGQGHEKSRVQLREIEVSLDRCWDLLRQRRARLEFHQDPGNAHIRSADVVERYLS